MAIDLPIENGFAAVWPAPAHIKTWLTTRLGGVSAAPYTSFNLGDHVADDPLAVAANRQRLAQTLPSEPTWLKQVHSVAVHHAQGPLDHVPIADAVFTRQAGVVAAVLTADCLPVLFCDRQGSVVAAAHAGWRGLCDGVLEATIAAMGVAPDTLLAYLGPAIGPLYFEVGPEVRAAFIAQQFIATEAFRAGQGDRWFADIFLLARQRLVACGVPADAIYGGEACTVSDAARFFSYRRDGVTGRMASCIWRE